MRGGLFTVIACMAGASPALAAPGQSASALGQAEAVIIAPIMAVSINDLDFGSLTSSPSASGAVTVAAEGGANYTGGASPACAGGGSCAGITPARFRVSGEAGRSYTVSGPLAITATGTLMAGGAAPALAIDALTVHLDSHAGAITRIGQLDDKGEDRIAIGGRLTVPAGTAAAHYRATLTIMVTYS
ncbi:hypothetical protein AQZ52_08155 [Novosphingobium fuchskuhlense]|uniref:DUF4402 domain-containing protein n=1 Tax=Novosphingobium fuchskuhlense TaxID=1117702 RepID=A0A124JUU1_9SPHN|nr:DUF4402 domain-containing protein [Novosphingobium fuchskuhlense]KUR71584.1 hypothetical protein AQZ52_08155 [Novosphingobium fuchskuhlense]